NTLSEIHQQLVLDPFGFDFVKTLYKALGSFALAINMRVYQTLYPVLHCGLQITASHNGLLWLSHRDADTASQLDLSCSL
ncbi:hypothetical protein STEG23_004484, partial [Scotinomys teguina]